MSMRFVLLFYTVTALFSGSAISAQVFKIATIAPDTTTWMKQMRNGAAQIEEKTAGRVKFKFYPGGVMGNDRAVLRKLRIGQLQGGAVTTGTLSQIFPDAQIYSLPLEFKSVDEVMYVRKHMDHNIAEDLEKKGLILLGMSNGGFAYIAGKSPVRDTEQLKQQRVWVPEGDTIGTAMFEAADITPVPLAISDVYTALQTGLLDTIIANPSSIIAFQWHTKVKYMTDVPLLFLMGTLVVDKRAFDKVDIADQQIMRNVMAEIFAGLDDLNYRDNLAARKVLVSSGVEIVKSDNKEQQLWKSFADSALKKLLEDGQCSQRYVDMLRKHLREYRSQAASDG